MLDSLGKAEAIKKPLIAMPAHLHGGARHPLLAPAARSRDTQTTAGRGPGFGAEV